MCLFLEELYCGISSILVFLRSFKETLVLGLYILFSNEL
ncbi:FACT complex subunit SSRP1 [Psidium guajava]|nr:FACT complex subunit SSRP1 [Psidium guajava]